MKPEKSIAMITGASGGIGAEFVHVLEREPIDEIWIVGRNRERLLALKERYGAKLVPICADLTSPRELSGIRDLFTENLRIAYLVNNAGSGSMKPSREHSTEEIEQTLRLNCAAPAILTNYCIPHMQKGGKIINVASAAAFQPVPFLNLYAAEKAFELHYSRALGAELKPLGITVTAVTPSWVDTKMLTKEINGRRVIFHGIVSPERVAEQAVRDAKKGKDVSVCSFYVKCQRLNVKLLPHRLVMKIWTKGIQKYLGE